MVAHAFDYSTLETEAGKSLFEASLVCKELLPRETVLEEKKEKIKVK